MKYTYVNKAFLIYVHNRSKYTPCNLQAYVFEAEIFALLHPQIYVRVDLLVHASGRICIRVFMYAPMRLSRALARTVTPEHFELFIPTRLFLELDRYIRLNDVQTDSCRNTRPNTTDLSVIFNIHHQDS